jgi:site-specific DNA recombinase
VINEAHAAIIRRIFMDFAAEKSPKKIAYKLNQEKHSRSRRNRLGPFAINSNYKRGTAILNNGMSIGRLLWNRQRFTRQPTPQPASVSTFASTFS